MKNVVITVLSTIIGIIVGFFGGVLGLAISMANDDRFNECVVKTFRVDD